MVDETASHDAQGPNESGLSQVSEVILGQVTALPAPFQRTFWKAFGRLATSAVEIPAAYMDGKAAQIRATSDARVQAIKTSGAAIASQLQVPPAYVEAASLKYAERIVGRQKNLDAIVSTAAGELARLLPSGLEVDPVGSAEISDDWLNTFEAEAENMSSDYMRTVFGKLLANEVKRPGAFSRRSVKILGQMERQEAEIFARFCSLAVQFEVDGKVLSGLLMTLGEDVEVNGLSRYGLDYRSLMTLIDYGLVLGTFSGRQRVEMSKHVDDDVTFLHAGKNYRYVSEVPGERAIELAGITTTRAGTELMQLVTPIPDPEYSAQLDIYLRSQSLRLDRLM